MPRPSKSSAVAPCPRRRPRKPSGKARFAPIRLDGAVGVQTGSAPLAAAFELSFPDGLILRVSRDADPVTLEQFFLRLRWRME